MLLVDDNMIIIKAMSAMLNSKIYICSKCLHTYQRTYQTLRLLFATLASCSNLQVPGAVAQSLQGEGSGAQEGEIPSLDSPIGDKPSV